MKLPNVTIVGVKQQSNGRSAKCGKLVQKCVLKLQLLEAYYKKTAVRLFCSAQKVGLTKWSSFFTQVAYKMFIVSQNLDFYQLQGQIWV